MTADARRRTRRRAVSEEDEVEQSIRSMCAQARRAWDAVIRVGLQKDRVLVAIKSGRLSADDARDTLDLLHAEASDHDAAYRGACEMVARLTLLPADGAGF